MAETPTFGQTIYDLVDSRLRAVHTWLPCLVKSYDEAKQLVDVEPQVTLPHWDDDEQQVKFEPAPRIGGCPVAFMGAGGFRITLPIEPDKTTGVLLVAESPIEKWLAEGPKVVDPFWTRRHHLNDAIFIPMLKPSGQAFTDVPKSDSMTVGRDGGPQLVITKDLVQLGGTPSSPPDDFVALSSPTKDELKKLHDTLKDLVDNLKQNNALAKANNALTQSHTHQVAASTFIAAPSVALSAMQSPSDPSGPSDVGDVKASVTKAK